MSSELDEDGIPSTADQVLEPDGGPTRPEHARIAPPSTVPSAEGDGGGPATSPEPQTPTAAATPGEFAGQVAPTDATPDMAAPHSGQRSERNRRGSRPRRMVVGALVVLFAILLPVTYVVAWTHYVVLTNRGFEKTVVPIGTDPAVTSAVGVALTNQIFSSLNPQETVARALPPRASFLAGPITNAAKGYVQQGVTAALQSDQFQTLWKQAVDFAHAQLLSVLNGNSKAVTTTNGQVVLNLVPLFNAALQNLQGFISGAVGKPVKLPAISGNEIPASACQKVGTALNRPVPSTCGQIPLFPAAKLTAARHLVRVFDGVLVLLLILTAVVAAMALWLSRRRRRTLLQLSVGGLLGLVIIRRVVNWLTTSLTMNGPPANKPARQAILTHLFHQYFSISRWLLVGLIVVFAVALVTGPYGWAVSLRRFVAHWAREGWNLVAAISGRARQDGTLEWVRAHLDLLRIGGVALAIFLLIVISVSWVGFLVIAVLLAAFEWWLHRLGRSTQPPPSPALPGSPLDGPADENPPPSGQPGSAHAV